jgi:predicted  nucleic acid-binding Zn-ribbon protein
MEPVLTIFLKSVLPSLVVGFGAAYLTATKKFATIETEVQHLKQTQEELEAEQERMKSGQDEIRYSLKDLKSSLDEAMTLLRLLAANRDVENLDLDI